MKMKFSRAADASGAPALAVVQAIPCKCSNFWYREGKFPMKIRQLLPTLGLLAGLFSAPVMAADPVVLKFSHEAPENQAKGLTAKFFADKVAELSNGSLKIEVFPSAQLIPTKDEVRAAMR